MSLATATRLVQYTLSGSGQVLPTTFKFFTSADLKVTKTVAGVDTLLVLTTDYTVSGGGTTAATGNVTMVAGTAGDIVTIEGNAAQTQGTDLTTGGPLPATSLTAQVDRLTMLVQQLKLQTDRSVRVPNTSAAVSPLTYASRVTAFPYYDASGNLTTMTLANLSLAITAGASTVAANLVAAGPTTGSAAAPTFRALVAADLATVLASPPAIGGTARAAGAFSSVGVGTSSPVYAIDAQSTGSTAVRVFDTASSTSAILTTANGTEAGLSGMSSTGAFAFFVNGTERGRFTSTGLNNAAIGATTPSTAAFTSASATSGFVVNVSAVDSFGYEYKKSGVSRWLSYISGAESGSNTGSSLIFQAIGDAGSALGIPLSISRSTLKTTLIGLENTPIGATTANTGAFTTVSATGLVTTAASNTTNAGLRLPHGAAPTSPTNGDFWSTTAGFYGRVNGATVGPFGTGGAGTGVAIGATITQAAHGFSVGQAVYNNAGTWALAKANASATALPLGVIAAVTTNTFDIVYQGAITGLSGLTPGSVYYLSDATAGLLTTTAPTSVTSYLVPTLYAATATVAYVVADMPSSLALPTVAEGGTGVATLTGLVKGNGTSAFTAAVQGTDYYAPAGTDVAVVDGGTGVSSLTAYAVLCGGTTSTGAVQSVASVGTSGWVLTSNGAGALPTFQASSASAPTINAQTGTTYTLVLGDANNIVTMSNASANTLTVPLNASVAFVVGTQIPVQMLGAGTTTIAATGGVTINSPYGLVIAARYAWVTLLKTATDTWQLSGGPSVVTASGKILTVNNTLTFTGTDATTMTFPTTSATLARTDAANTFVGTQTYSGGILVTGATTGLGYATGAGGAVTQITSRATGVTINKPTGTITTVATSLAAATRATFTVTNSTVAIRDTIQISVVSGPTADTSKFFVTAVAAGSFDITAANLNASTADTGAAIINFAVIKAVNA